MTWITSSVCPTGSAGAEVSLDGHQIRLRNSNDRGGPSVAFDPVEWVEFLAAVIGSYLPYNTDRVPDGSVLVFAPKHRGGPPVYLSADEYEAFKFAALGGEFDLDRVPA